MKKKSQKIHRVQVYGNMTFGATDQPTAISDLPDDFLKAKLLWDQDSEKNIKKICTLLEKYIKAIFLPHNIESWEELFVDEDGAGMPECPADQVRLSKITYQKGQFIPNCGAEAIFSVPVTPEFLKQEDLQTWQDEHDYFFAGVMFGWEIPRNENTEEFLHINPSIRRCKAFHDYCQSHSDLSEFSKDIEVFKSKDMPS